MSGGISQFGAADTSIDLAWGHPAEELLPDRAVGDAARRAVLRHGPDSLGYGATAGPQPAIEQIRRRLAIVDSRVPARDELLVTAGVSAALDHLTTVLAAPGDVVLVEAPTYHLAIRILADHPVTLASVPTDREGIDVDALASTARRLRAEGRRVRLVYSVPTFQNPTGVTISGERRRALARTLRAEELLLVEDDTYRELAYEGDPPPSVWSEAASGSVVRLGSFSKSLAPGLRLGYLTASAEIVARFVGSGMLDSGGGTAHLQALVLAELMESGFYAENVARLRAAYRARRDALVAGLDAEIAPLGGRYAAPAGGYFLWLTMPGRDARAVMPTAEACGTGFLPGPTFHLDRSGSADAFRLSFSRYAPDELREAAARLRRALEAGAGA